MDIAQKKFFFRFPVIDFLLLLVGVLGLCGPQLSRVFCFVYLIFLLNSSGTHPSLSGQTMNKTIRHLQPLIPYPLATTKEVSI